MWSADVLARTPSRSASGTSIHLINYAGSANNGTQIRRPDERHDDAITVRRFGTGSFNATVSNNTLKNFGGAGSDLNLDKTGSIAVKLSGNNISNPYNDPGNTSPNASPPIAQINVALPAHHERP